MQMPMLCMLCTLCRDALAAMVSLMRSADMDAAKLGLQVQRGALFLSSLT